MTTKQIREAFEALSGIFNSAHQNYAEMLLDECCAEERGHRGFMDGFNRCHTADTIGIKDAGRLFAVKRVAEYIKGGWTKFPHGKDYLHTQKSCFTAAAIADEFKTPIAGDANGNGGVWSPALVDELAALDYTDFVKIKGEKYQPKTGEACSCRPGQERDNCPQCEGTGMRIDFKAIRAA